MEGSDVSSQENRSPSGVTVVLPHQLREQAGGRRSVTVSPGTVREIVRALDQECPGMVFRLCYETGEMRPYVNVFVASESIKYLQGLDTPVSDGAEVSILPAVAGG